MIYYNALQTNANMTGVGDATDDACNAQSQVDVHSLLGGTLPAAMFNNRGDTCCPDRRLHH